MAALNHIYLEHPALSEWDYKDEGFRWLDCHQEQRGIYAILRKGGEERLAAIFNFSNRVQEGCQVEIREPKKACKVLLYSDWERFGGGTPETESLFTLENSVLTCTLKPFSAGLIQLTE